MMQSFVLITAIVSVTLWALRPIPEPVGFRWGTQLSAQELWLLDLPWCPPEH